MRVAIAALYLMGLTSSARAELTPDEKTHRFVTNLRHIAASAADQKAAGKELLQAYPDGIGLAPAPIPEKAVAATIGAVIGFAKAKGWNVLATAASAGVVAFATPSETSLEIDDVLNSARSISAEDRRAVVIRDLATLPTDGWKKLLQTKPSYADRVLLVLQDNFAKP